jgi:biotin/methionine sulfoxide reductase
VIGNYEDLTRRNVTWEQIEQQTDIVVAFGGLAAVRLTDGIRPGVIQLPTGSWYDPEDPDEDALLCVHGNPNVLTADVGTSALAQGCTGQLTTVQVELFKGNLPPIKAYDPP